MSVATPPLPQLLLEWLPRQRWFPAKGQDVVLRRLGGIRLPDPGEKTTLAVHIVAVHTGKQTYVVNVPVSLRNAPLEGAEQGLIGELNIAAGGAEEERRWLYDGAYDPLFVAAWLEMMRGGVRTRNGRARGHAASGFDQWQPFEGPLRTKVLAGEQSNTSVVVEAGQTPLIVKFFRVLEAGSNPDVEIGVMLSGLESADVPTTFGWVTGSWLTLGQPDDGDQLWDSGHLSVLREFIPDSEDAWRAASSAAVANEDFTAQARELGAVTGRIHRQLAKAGGSHAASPEELSALVEDLTERIRWGWAQAGAAVGPLDEAVEEVLDRLTGLPQGEDRPELQPIHADYHLGQVLHSTRRGWVVLDFEGEPLRPLGSRGTDDVPIRDVVGMLRSFDYAAGVALLAARENGRGDAEAAAEQWAADAKAAFLEGYEAESGTAVDTSAPLFLGLWLDKALYEVVYEQRNRPHWVDVPVQAVRRELERISQPTVPEEPAMDSKTSPKPTPRGRKASGKAAATGADPATGAQDGLEPVAGAFPENTAAIVPGEDGPRPVPVPLPAMEGEAAPATGTPSLIPPIESATPVPVDEHVLASVAHGSYYQPHAVLGAHLDDHGHVTVRTLRKMAETVTLVTSTAKVSMRHEYGGIWVAVVEPERRGHVPDYRIEVTYPDGEPELVDDPYRYLPTVGEVDLYLIGEGRHEMLWSVLGAHVRHYNSMLGDISGTSFAVWAPNAQAVRVKGEFNGWDGSVHAMRSLGGAGVWELFIPGVQQGAIYKFELLGRDGRWHERADPMARWTEVPPLTGSRVLDSRYVFSDESWMVERAQRDPHNGPMSVYEVHLGSWRLGLGYRELAEELVDYVTELGFTHVEFMPVAEHPFGGSWGYQVTSYFAPTSRFGHPDDFKYLVDKLHQAGIGVIVDWVPAHFPKDEWALARFDGQPLYEHSDPRLGEHPDWGTLIFDFGRSEVRNFLVANALYWLEEFHVDGLRVDAVASMLYRDYSRQDGQWYPNIHGGRENLEAISFLQEVNATAYRRVPGIVTIAEESTAFPGVTRPTSGGGLGFGLKWNMGWMHDTLEYISEDPVHRMYHHDKATFSMVYAFTENFLLPISHDEVVHGKGSMLSKMPGDRWKQLANLRAYLAFQWAHPGKQLIFMGTEFGQETEWSEQHGLDWWLAENAPHQGLQSLVGALNRMYRETPALYERDNEPAGFQWIDASDGARNTLSFIRWDRHGNPLVCIANFAGHPHEEFRVGLPWAGQWTEVLNTDAEIYGGSGVGNADPVQASDGAWNGYPASAVITVPPLGVLYLKAVQ